MYIRKYTRFSTLHPVLLLFYALAAPLLAMFSKEPAELGISFVCAVCIHGFYLGRQATWEGIKFVLPFILLIAALNALTNHRGTTILFRWGGFCITWESLRYGLACGVMLGAVILWFRCFSALVPNHKFLYLFGRRFAGTGLLLSMILKLFPDTGYKIRCIRFAQGPLQEDEREGSFLRLRRSLRQTSSLLEWSMEDSIETADSMKARGYGEGRRTSYERYSFTLYDAGVLLVMCLLLFGQGVGVRLGGWKTLAGFLSGIWFLLMPIWMQIGKRGGRRG